jgi:hypothetical protein
MQPRRAQDQGNAGGATAIATCAVRCCGALFRYLYHKPKPRPPQADSRFRAQVEFLVPAWRMHSGSTAKDKDARDAGREAMRAKQSITCGAAFAPNGASGGGLQHPHPTEVRRAIHAGKGEDTQPTTNNQANKEDPQTTPQPLHYTSPPHHILPILHPSIKTLLTSKMQITTTHTSRNSPTGNKGKGMGMALAERLIHCAAFGPHHKTAPLFMVRSWVFSSKAE